MDPLIVVDPAYFPVPVDPETVMIVVLADENDPPLQPEGAERLVVPLTVMVEGETVTDPVEHDCEHEE